MSSERLLVRLEDFRWKDATDEGQTWVLIAPELMGLSAYLCIAF